VASVRCSSSVRHRASTRPEPLAWAHPAVARRLPVRGWVVRSARCVAAARSRGAAPYPECGGSGLREPVALFRPGGPGGVAPLPADAFPSPGADSARRASAVCRSALPARFPHPRKVVAVICCSGCAVSRGNPRWRVGRKRPRADGPALPPAGQRPGLVRSPEEELPGRAPDLLQTGT
jgi:hypothetical protein